MKIFMKRAALLLLMITSAFPVWAEVLTGSCGTNATYNFDTETGLLEIKGSGAMNDYTDSSPRAPWSSYLFTVKKVTIARGITSIGNHSFNSCMSLNSISIPSSVTSIGKYAFIHCHSLTSVTIPNSIKSIGVRAFADCSDLTSLTIPNSVTSIGEYAFYKCSSLTSITIPNSVTSIESSVFYGCSGLTSINIPNSVTSIGGYAFSGCSGLTSINIPNSVTSIGRDAFSDCGGLTSITIPHSVSSIGEDAFFGCLNVEILKWGSDVNPLTTDLRYVMSQLKSLYLLDGITSIGDNAFTGCSGLTSLTIPNSVTSIGDHAFQNCSALTSISIPGSVTSIGNEPFSLCSKVKTLIWGSNLSPRAVTQSFSSNLKTVYMLDGITSIGDRAFYGCTGLTSITIPNSVTSIGDYAFSGCSGLTSITIPSTLQKIFGGAFVGCKSLTSVNLPSTLEIFAGNAFYDCTSLTEVTFASVPQYLDPGYNKPTNRNVISLTDDSYIYTGSNPYMPTCTNATYTRSIAASSNWGTLVLPYTITSDENVQLFELSDVSGEAMTFSEVDQVAANTPCVFKKKDATATSLTFAATDVNVTATATPSVNSVDGWTVKGTYERLTDQTGMYYIAQDGFWKADKGIGIKSFRAWFENAGSQVKAFSIFAQENDMEDSIEALEKMNGGAVEYYDLNGRRMDGLQKGINIIKYGQDKTKKVIIK